MAVESQNFSEIPIRAPVSKNNHNRSSLLSRNKLVFFLLNVFLVTLFWLLGEKLQDISRFPSEIIHDISIFWISVALFDLVKESFSRSEFDLNREMLLDQATQKFYNIIDEYDKGIQEVGLSRRGNSFDEGDPNPGGYIVIDMPEDQKRMFYDVLKGFEEFALLKGYSVSFSFNGSVPDKVAFKFTILDKGVSVSSKKVQDDLKDYIARVQNGDSLDDLPIVLPGAEHAALVLVMRNRINFLQHTYSAMKNVVDFYERILREGGLGQIGLAPAQNFYLQGGGAMSSKNYTAIGSSRVVQGEDNEVDQSVHVAESFIEKKEQIENIEALIQALTNVNQPAPTQNMRAVVNLEKVKDELASERKPDAFRIKKWLETAQSSIKALALGKDVIDLAAKTFKGFELPF